MKKNNICENCGKNPATTYFKQNINGKVTETFLCSECAKKKGLSTFMASDFDLWSPFSFGNSQQLTESKKCDCGMTFDEISRTGMVGCAKCYEVFRNELAYSLKKIHGDRKHVKRLGAVGIEKKEPTKVSATKGSDVETLKKQLSKAISEERFEDAAKLRDSIRKIEGNGASK